MKDQARNTRDKPSQIFAQVVAQCDDDVQALMPREENCKKTMRYRRPAPPIPATLADVNMLEEYTLTTNNAEFLQFDNGEAAQNRMLVFYSPESLERLTNAQTFFMDGNFSVVPQPFKQLYVIRIPFKDVSVTGIYAFLPNKRQETYIELFQSIVDECNAINQQLVFRL